METTIKPADEIAYLQERLDVLLARQGDEAAFRRLVDAYERRVLYFILRFVDDADQALDILQEVWLSVFRLLPRLEAVEAFRVWLYKIVHGKIAGFRRSRRRVPAPIESCDNLPPEAGAASDEATFEDADLVHRGLADLSIEHREVLTLHFLEGMRLEEIAQALSCPLGTVKSRIHHAKRSLRAIIERLTDGRA